MTENEFNYHQDHFGVPYERLPATLPVFPLTGAMLLPHGRMPLNIFEPRYLSMVLDSLKKSRLIGMVQPLNPGPEPISKDTVLFKTGCAGRITAFAETDDGRIMITLQGVCRFEIADDLETKTPYRQIRPNFDLFREDLSPDYPEVNRDGLIPVLKQYLNLKGIKINWEDINKIEDRLLIATIGMINPFDYREKQAILETQSVRDISDVIVSLMEMELATVEKSSTKH